MLGVTLSDGGIITLVEIDDDDVSVGYLGSSYIYELILDDNKEILNEQTLLISQIVPAKGYDKFSVKILEKDTKPIIVRLEFEFIFDNGKRINTEECILPLRCMLLDEQIGMYNDGSCGIAIENAIENYKELLKFEEYGCKNVSDYFFKLLDSYKYIIGDL